MLTATYSLVAIHAEQDKAHSILSRLQQYIRGAWQGLQALDFSFLESAFNKMLHFDDYCRSRKVELYLIPAMRRVTSEADALIAELESLSAAGAGLLRSIRNQLAGALDSGGAAGEIHESMERYCDNMRARLGKEDTELFPMARRVLSIEEWFSVAAQFLSEEERNYGRRRRSHSMPLHRMEAAAAAIPARVR